MNTVTGIYFSPTQTTQRILSRISQGLQAAPVREINLTQPAAPTEVLRFRPDDFVVIGVPVYAGRIPMVAAERLKRLQGDNTPAAIVVVYGNRAYEDALLELAALVREVGFIPIAAGAFIGEHSFSNGKTPIAEGRPDAQDLREAEDFGAQIKAKITQTASVDKDAVLSVPGNFPYKDSPAWPQIAPVIVEDQCNLCGDCVDACPTAAIAIDKTVVTDKAKCIFCCACVKVCPLDARIMEESLVKKTAQWLYTHCRERKTPEIFV